MFIVRSWRLSMSTKLQFLLKRTSKRTEEKKRSSNRLEEKKIVEIFQDSHRELVAVEDNGNLDVEKQPALVFFGEENERFNIDELLNSEAELQGQSFYSSLYKVKLNSGTVFVVKRLRNLRVSTEDFKSTVTWIGNLKHPNLLPLVACHASDDDKLLIYRFQTGSLSNLLSNYAGGNRDFPWKFRLSIAYGIAKGLQYIENVSCNRNMPHGNLKPSNILLNEFEEPQISEYGMQSLIDPKWEMLYSYNGYKAPEKTLTEKADIYSYGIILLQLLTGKAVDNSCIDLPQWVKAKIREEWTGEVFDSEVNRMAGQWALPLLNIALQCVSHMPEQRPTISDTLEKIEHVIKEQDDFSFSSTSSVECSK
ncbi:hypothetical protein Taro_034029 [Colocasia esculenta]|uniref:Protein kinase domain-containing protein n=1 Tax=Colocasia esculenta TaxID=4460 RepID=A0A843VZK8_COLES|nr:hypothetical protein [Colocasia esculenta]